jgi:transposase
VVCDHPLQDGRGGPPAQTGRPLHHRCNTTPLGLTFYATPPVVFVVAQNPENLTGRQAAKLSSIQKTNARLYRAYLLKEQLRQIYRLPAAAAVELLDEWIAWARRCRLASFVKLAKTVTAQRAGIVAAIEHGLSNARVEQVNTQIRMITRRAYGFHSPAALIALAMLSLAGLCPPLPS